MNQLTESLKRYSLAVGILLMFLLTWPIDMANSGVLPFRVPFVVALLVGYGFVFASLIMTGLTLGKSGVIALLKRFLIWRVGWHWYLVPFLLVPCIYLITLFLNAEFSQTPIDFSTVFAHRIFGPSANLALFIVPFFVVDAITNGEEIGWRGYLLPRLQAKHNALVSSLMVGVIWGLWHIPKYVSHWDTVAFAWFIVHTMAFAVLLTWLYNNTKGSLLLATLFHASSNTASVFLPLSNTASSNSSALIIQVLVEAIVVIVITFTAGPARLSRTGSKQVQV